MKFPRFAMPGCCRKGSRIPGQRKSVSLVTECIYMIIEIIITAVCVLTSSGLLDIP